LESLIVSAEGKTAVRELVEAERFETGFVGFAGSPSSYINRFNTVLRETEAARLFKYIFDEGSTAGKLYALSGLYLTDREEFNRAADIMKKSGQTVQVLNGCLISDESVAKIVESDAANVAIIEPGKTMKEFWETNAGAHELDIAHGGYPATFREMADIKPVVRKRG
jgi:hypothetical protein